MPDLSSRVDRSELMDTMSFDEPVVRRTLGFLGMTARRFGGAGIIRRKLESWSSAWRPSDEISILDVGSGGAEIPVALAAWARRTGKAVRVTAVDLMPEIAAIATENAAAWPEVNVRCADVFSFERSGETFDYVTASLFLHHVPTPKIVPMLQLFDRIARRGVIVSDLKRSRPSYWSVKLLSQLTGNHVVRHDAPLSVERSFTPDELGDFAAAAGLRYLRVQSEPWFRLSLSGEKK